MTEQELIDYGYHPEECKIGRLYFKPPFFLDLKDGVVDLRPQERDDLSLGKTDTLEGLKSLEAGYFIHQFRIQRLLVATTYGNLKRNYSEYLPKAETFFIPEIEAFEKVNNTWYESNFDPAVDRKKLFIEALGEELYKSDWLGNLYRGE